MEQQADEQIEHAQERVLSSIEPQIVKALAAARTREMAELERWEREEMPRIEQALRAGATFHGGARVVVRITQ